MLLLFLLLLVFYRIEIIRNSLAVILKIIIFKNFFIVILDLAQFVALDCVDLLTGCFVLRLRTVIKIIDLQYKVQLSNQRFIRTYSVTERSEAHCLLVAVFSLEEFSI